MEGECGDGKGGGGGERRSVVIGSVVMGREVEGERGDRRGWWRVDGRILVI